MIIKSILGKSSSDTKSVDCFSDMFSGTLRLSSCGCDICPDVLCSITFSCKSTESWLSPADNNVSISWLMNAVDPFTKAFAAYFC